MNKEVKPVELTQEENEQIEQNCIEYAKTYNVPKVYACVQLKQDGTNDRVISYVKEPNYTTKLVMMDKASMIGAMQASDELRQMCQLRTESDPLTYGEGPECDFFKLGVSRFCMDMVVYATNQFKKK